MNASQDRFATGPFSLPLEPRLNATSLENPPWSPT